jgi:hypothetical protein
LRGQFSLPLLCLFSIAVHAQSTPSDVAQEYQRAFGRHQINVDGATNPDAIPFGVALETVFLRFTTQVERPDVLRESVRAKYSGNDADLQRLVEIAEGAKQFAEEVRYEEGRSYDAACAKVVAAEPWNSIDAVQVAQEFQRIEARRLELIDKHYKAAVDSLSRSARSTLLNDVDTNVRPKIQWSTLNQLGVATESPDLYLYDKRLICEKWLATPVDQKTWKVLPPQPLTAN